MDVTERPAHHRHALQPEELVDGRYRVLGLLNAGLHTELYRAQQLADGAAVVLKLLVPPAHDETARLLEARFLAEHGLATQIACPHVIRTLGHGYAGAAGLPYVCLEWLEGHDLQSELDAGPIAPARALRLALDALTGLASIHRAGIVHRDLKPLNLFVVDPGGADERLVILDFGVAHASAADSRLTDPGALAGTPQYLPPEYITARQVVPAFDVYQMGLVLVEMFTGSPVVQHESTFLCMAMHTLGKLPVPPELTRSPLGPVIARALERSPERRYPHAAAMAEALADVRERAVAALCTPGISPTHAASSSLQQTPPHASMVIDLIEEPRACWSDWSAPARTAYGPGRYVGSCYHGRADIEPRRCVAALVGATLLVRPATMNKTHDRRPTHYAWSLLATALLVAVAMFVPLQVYSVDAPSREARSALMAAHTTAPGERARRADPASAIEPSLGWIGSEHITGRPTLATAGGAPSTSRASYWRHVRQTHRSTSLVGTATPSGR